jgi:protein SCO1/2
MPSPRSLLFKEFRLRKTVYGFALSILLSPLLASGAEPQNKPLKSGVFEPPRLAPAFNLPASTGKEFKLDSQRGKLVVLGFGFSHCPDVCPVTLAILAQVRKQLGTLADQVQVVYVTVDPERDTPARLREYLAVFDSTFIGITGKPEQLSALRQEYGIIATRAEGKDVEGGYLVHHSSYIYLIDRQGRLRALVPFGKTAADIAHDIKILLQEPA